jgi:hypothetical protein
MEGNRTIRYSSFSEFQPKPRGSSPPGHFLLKLLTKQTYYSPSFRYPCPASKADTLFQAQTGSPLGLIRLSVNKSERRRHRRRNRRFRDQQKGYFRLQFTQELEAETGNQYQYTGQVLLLTRPFEDLSGLGEQKKRMACRLAMLSRARFAVSGLKRTDVDAGTGNSSLQYSG